MAETSYHLGQLFVLIWREMQEPQGRYMFAPSSAGDVCAGVSINCLLPGNLIAACDLPLPLGRSTTLVAFKPQAPHHSFEGQRRQEQATGPSFKVPLSVNLHSNTSTSTTRHTRATRQNCHTTNHSRTTTCTTRLLDLQLLV